LGNHPKYLKTNQFDLFKPKFNDLRLLVLNESDFISFFLDLLILKLKNLSDLEVFQVLTGFEFGFGFGYDCYFI
jgi:hypothetical protein